MADLTEPGRFRYRLDFTEEALDTYGEGARVLSLALPLRASKVEDRHPTKTPVANFLEGLLPEGNLRRQVATATGVQTYDKIGLLCQVGAECAGAVQFLAQGEQPSSGSVRRLTADEIDSMVRDLPSYHLPEGTELQASLAGIQDKVLLTRMSSGDWGWPSDGAASTHIVKPEPTVSNGVLDHLVQTEDWALRVAREAGFNAAQTQLDTFDGRQAIVIERYDRDTNGNRLHQEDFCQALSLPPDAKYEPKFGSRPGRLSQIAQLAAPRSRDPDAFRTDLLRTVTFNIAIGNGDAHSKNYSLLLADDGEVSLAPIYDSAPSMYLDERFSGTGHVIGHKTNIKFVTTDDLVNEATSWGLSSRRARRIVDQAMTSVHDIAHTVTIPDGAERVISQLEAQWQRRQWPTSAPTGAAPR